MFINKDTAYFRKYELLNRITPEQFILLYNIVSNNGMYLDELESDKVKQLNVKDVIKRINRNLFKPVKIIKEGTGRIYYQVFDPYVLIYVMNQYELLNKLKKNRS